MFWGSLLGRKTKRSGNPASLPPRCPRPPCSQRTHDNPLLSTAQSASHHALRKSVSNPRQKLPNLVLQTSECHRVGGLSFFLVSQRLPFKRGLTPTATVTPTNQAYGNGSTSSSSCHPRSRGEVLAINPSQPRLLIS